MQVIVPDASVLLKWVLSTHTEGHHEQALNIRTKALTGEIRLIVPSLWLYEVGNTLTRHFPQHSLELLRAFILFGLDEAPWTDPWLDRCVSLMQTYDITFYDASYHSLALVENGCFVTADRQYVAKTIEAGAVMALADWPQ